jgi:putative ABC transport system permease protein
LNQQVASLCNNISAAWHSLRENLQRAVLSATGITVGAAAIILLVSVARGVEADVSKQVTGLGVNLLVVVPGQISDSSLFSPNLAGISYLRDEDVTRVRKVPGVERAAPLMFVGGGIRNGKHESQSTFIIGAGPDWFYIHPSKLSEGRFYTEADNHSRVCVIGSIAKESLFGSSDALGKTVKINGGDYKAIGVTIDPKAEDSLFSMGGFENMAYLPYEQVRDSVPNPQLNRIMIESKPDFDPKLLVPAVQAALAQRLSRQQFSVLTQKDLLDVVFRIMSLLTSLLAGLTSIALVVGGLGIMTVMLMSVGERSKEIGIRKTVGAKQSDIFIQFLAEAVILTCLGGIAGLGISYAGGVLLASLTKIRPEFSVGVVALGLIVSLVTGTIFGLLPAMKAARKDPVASLRSE